MHSTKIRAASTAFCRRREGLGLLWVVVLFLLSCMPACARYVNVSDDAAQPRSDGSVAPVDTLADTLVDSAMDQGGEAIVNDLGGGDVLDSIAPSVRNRIFVTSIPITPDDLLARGAGDPLEGGDLYCTERAGAAGLSGTYRAWLSTSFTDARTRFSGRGWYRMDGLPFADSIESLVDEGKIYYPVALDEHGDSVGNARVMTATNNLGLFVEPYSCADWADTGGVDSMLIGRASGGGTAWTTGWYSACTDALQIYCLGVGGDAPVTITPPPGRVAFLSSTWRPGSGLGGADDRCMADAAAAGLPGNFAALLATVNSTAADRLPQGSIWVRTDGIPIESFPGDLAQHLSVAAIEVAADGVTYPSKDGSSVWLGASSFDQVSTPEQSCDDWQSGDVGDTGRITYTGVTGTMMQVSYNDVACDTDRRLFCLEQ